MKTKRGKDMKARSVIAALRRDNMIGHERPDVLSALACWGALTIGPQKKNRARIIGWIAEAMQLSDEDKQNIKQYFQNLVSGGAIERGKIHFAGGADAGLEFALLINIARGYIEMKHGEKG